MSGPRPSAHAGGGDGRPARGRVHRGGFTLAEVVVAVVLLAVGLLASVSMVSLAARTLGEARRVSLAVAAAESLTDSLLQDGTTGASGMREHAWGVLRWGPGERPGDSRVVATDSAPAEPRPGARTTEGGTVLVELFLRLPDPPPTSDPEP